MSALLTSSLLCQALINLFRVQLDPLRLDQIGWHLLQRFRITEPDIQFPRERKPVEILRQRFRPAFLQLDRVDIGIQPRLSNPLGFR